MQNVVLRVCATTNLCQVWSFAPPEEHLERRSESPLSLPEQSTSHHDEELQGLSNDLEDDDAAMKDV